MRLEFFYDFSCPYAYLASTQVRALSERAGAELVYKPFLLGGVFKALGNAAPMTPMSAPRARLNILDMQRWAEHWEVPLNMPPGHPNRTVIALRAALASDDLARASHALFSAYWVDARDLSDPGVVADALGRAGFDGSALVQRAEAPEIKQQLFERTEEAVRRGLFGAPTFFVDGGERLWGQDRLDFVASALGLPDPPAPQGPLVVSELEFWFDFSSPFAYLASTQMQALSARTGARVVWRPFLLGGLFRAIGTPDVPLLGFAAPKQSFQHEDMQRFARRYRVPFAFPTRFPLRTVLPLRVVLLAGDRAAALTRALFHAAWADDSDISDPAVVQRICEQAGADPELVRRAEEPEAKELLKQTTDEAAARGLCGAPSFVVGESVFWGQDRLLFAEKALRGWRPRTDRPPA
jgi:2-hydroxychromene-2-carboxylate isomerase